MAPKHLAVVAATVFALAAPVAEALAAPPATRAGETATCAECGMTAKIEGRFTVRVGEGEQAQYLCDIGDFVVFLERTKPKELPVAAVHDFPTGAWVDAVKAFYVRDPRYHTPMDWSIAAFAERAEAAAAGVPLTFDELRAAPRP